MNASAKSKAGKQLIFAICLLAVAIAGYLVTSRFTPPAPQAGQNASSTPSSEMTTSTVVTSTVVTPSAREVRPGAGQQSIEGTYVCLPHRDADGPQTLECALGLKADDGNNYALSSAGAGSYSASATTPTGVRVRVTGTVIPVEASSESEWQKYAVSGVIQVTAFARI